MISIGNSFSRKKGIVHLKTQSLEIETPSRSDRITKLEQALKEQS
jgi:hypothetical protein